MSDEHLAVVSIPMQCWGSTFEDEKVFTTGTIFQELYKPFFAAEEEEIPVKKNDDDACDRQKDRETIISCIMQTGFILDDLTLYLDMHKADSEALKMYVEKSQKLYELKKEFAQKFYPVTRDFMLYGVNDKEFGWMEGPMPWEGACI